MAKKKTEKKADDNKVTIGKVEEKKVEEKKGKKVESEPAHVPEPIVSVRSVTGVRKMTLSEYEALKKK